MLTCHAFYAAPDTSNRVAQPDDPEMVPDFLYFDPALLIDQVRKSGAENVPDRELWADFMRFYVPLNSMDMIVLRHRSVPAFPVYLPGAQ